MTCKSMHWTYILIWLWLLINNSVSVRRGRTDRHEKRLMSKSRRSFCPWRPGTPAHPVYPYGARRRCLVLSESPTGLVTCAAGVGICKASWSLAASDHLDASGHLGRIGLLLCAAGRRAGKPKLRSLSGAIIRPFRRRQSVWAIETANSEKKIPNNAETN